MSAVDEAVRQLNMDTDKLFTTGIAYDQYLWSCSRWVYYSNGHLLIGVHCGRWDSDQCGARCWDLGQRLLAKAGGPTHQFGSLEAKDRDDPERRLIFYVVAYNGPLEAEPVYQFLTECTGLQFGPTEFMAMW